MGSAPAPPAMQNIFITCPAACPDWPVLPLTCTELRLFSAAQFLFLIVDVEIPGELFVILHPVAGLLALPPVPGVALHPPVDDVDGGAEPGRQATSPVLSE